MASYGTFVLYSFIPTLSPSRKSLVVRSSVLFIELFFLGVDAHHELGDDVHLFFLGYTSVIGILINQDFLKVLENISICFSTVGRGSVLLLRMGNRCHTSSKQFSQSVGLQFSDIVVHFMHSTASNRFSHSIII